MQKVSSSTATQTGLSNLQISLPTTDDFIALKLILRGLKCQSDVNDINSELVARATSLKDEKSEKGSIALHYLQSIQAVKDSASDNEDILKEAVMAHDAHEQAEVDRNNAQRKAGLIQSNKKVALSIQENRGLIERFNKITGKEDSKAYDLLLPADRKELKSKYPKGYEKLKGFTEDLEELSLAMIARGASLEELQDAFAEIPNGLRPASFREEVARYHQVSRLIETDRAESSVLDAAHQRANRHRTAKQIEGSISNGFQALGSVLGDVDVVNTEIGEE